MGEAHYFENEHGERVDFDLNVYVAAGVVDVVEVGLRELEGFLKQFDPSYAEIAKVTIACTQAGF